MERDGTEWYGTRQVGTEIRDILDSATVTQGWDGQLGPCSRGREEKHHPETNGG